MDDLDLYDFSDMHVPGMPLEGGLLASGPFGVHIGDDVFVGIMLRGTEDGRISFGDMRHDTVIEADLVEVDGKKVVLKTENDEYVIKPLTDGEVKKLFGERFADVPRQEVLAASLLSYASAFGADVAVPQFFVTVSGSNVLGLFMKAADGSLHRRELGAWVKLEADTEDELDLEDLETVPVLSSVMEVFDLVEDEDFIDFETVRGFSL